MVPDAARVKRTGGKVRCPVGELEDSSGNANGNDGNDGKGRSRMVKPLWTDRSTAPQEVSKLRGISKR